MTILVACERSGIVRDALLAAGYDAISCDLEPSRRPGPHIQGDVRDIIGKQWTGMIAHPVCKYMANSGVRWLHERPERWELMRAGCEFFKLFDDADHIPARCVENPVMHGHALQIIGRSAEQYVQPHHFGDTFQKLTGFWLHGLPKLTRTHWLDKSIIKQEVWEMAPGPDREEKRSQTYPAIADAFAAQWGLILAGKSHPRPADAATGQD